MPRFPPPQQTPSLFTAGEGVAETTTLLSGTDALTLRDNRNAPWTMTDQRLAADNFNITPSYIEHIGTTRLLHPFVRLFVLLTVHRSVYLSFRPLVCPFISWSDSLHPSGIRLFLSPIAILFVVCPFVSLSVCPFIRFLFAHLSYYPFIRFSCRPFFRPFVFSALRTGNIVVGEMPVYADSSNSHGLNIRPTTELASVEEI